MKRETWLETVIKNTDTDPHKRGGRPRGRADEQPRRPRTKRVNEPEKINIQRPPSVYSNTSIYDKYGL